MHIKNIIISGFRSFREQSFPDGLSPHINTFIGKNGSGKSNFFAAVQFVLSEQFAVLTANERRELFHASNVSMTNILSTVVEIVFDNSDGRLVIPGRGDTSEVRIRRTLGYKTDEFRVNDCRFTASEVHQLLESAGFSSSNPYYIVEQGKIISIVNMSEKERYNLMKVIAGTNVYEARRVESEQILLEAESKVAHVDKLITDLNKRLDELEEESSELKDAERADEERRCLEHCIYQVETDNVKEKLEALNKQSNLNVTELAEREHTVELLEEEELRCKDRLSELDRIVHSLECDKRQAEHDVNAINQKAAVMEVDMQDRNNAMTRNDKERVALRKEETLLKQSLEVNMKECAAKRESYNSCEKESTSIMNKAEELSKEVDLLQERRNRSKLYKNKRERDEWLKREIAHNNTIITQFTEEQKVLSNTLVALEEEERQVALEIETMKKTLNNNSVDDHLDAKNFKKSFSERRHAAIQRRDAWNEQRRMLWQEIHEHEGVVQHLDETRRNAHFRLDRLMRQDIRQGLLSLHEVLEEVHDAALSSSVHGPLIDLITVEDNYHVAAEVTAGNVLFNVIVDSFDVSARLLAEMNHRRKPGRIAMLPLDTCVGKPRPIPITPLCCPLLSKLKYDAQYEQVMSEVFGHTAVVASLEEGGIEVAQQFHCDAVTVDGDQLSWKGHITGGYIDRRNMKLLQYTEEKAAIAALEDAKATLQSKYQAAAEVEQQITEVVQELELLQSQEQTIAERNDEQLRNIREQEEHLARLSREHANTQRALRVLEHNLEHVHKTINQLHAEMNEEFKPSWSVEDETMLTKCNVELAETRKVSVAVQTQLVQITTELQLSEDTVRHIKRQLEFVATRLKELGMSHETMGNVNETHFAAERELALLQSRVQQLDQELDATVKERQKLEMELERVKMRAMENSKDVAARQSAVEEAEMQRALLVQQEHDTIDKLQKLGTVNLEVLQVYKTFSLGKLMHLLQGVNEKLNSFAHVNRRALEQHHTLMTTRNELQRQRDDVLHERTSIRELLDHLERQKDEAIQRTYKQIQYQFEMVCKELIGDESCVAELQLVAADATTTTTTSTDDISNNACHTNSFADMYSGVRIRVSFGVGAAVSDLEQLSGGQKSLVALALIFAIQRCDPAPFYLFDEIDAALDPEYRLTVARMIKRQAEESQFIIASFKTEMVEIANSVFGLFYHNKVSRIQIISREEGVALLRQAALEDKHRARENNERVVAL